MKTIILDKYISSAFIFFLLIFNSSLSAKELFVGDTCIINDICETAIEIQDVFPDAPFVCVEGCNRNANPEPFNNNCQVGQTPTVWYKVTTLDATLLNIFVTSDEIESPTITVFYALDGCDDYIQVPMTAGDLPCIIGSNGEANALGTDIGSNSDYFIAIGSLDPLGGDFEICVNTISNGSNCVAERDISITARSFGGPLTGPFKPGETISVCMNVNSYTAAGNGCQWFQGLVPVFGNGWDPSSFDQDGQPLDATLNDGQIGVAGNGLYGASTWDWFSDVDYHHNDPERQLGDFDGNGTYEMCSIKYDPDCPNLGGIIGACCGPCWGAPNGDFLPNGWFAYGINGTCGTPGPPIGVDWGDGNSCGGGMGPWQFCFDLIVRDFPGCDGGASTKDLSIGFFTFSDGEVGSWTGGASVCAFDQPAMLTLPFDCVEIPSFPTELLPDQCSGQLFTYLIDEPGITHWTWSVSPASVVMDNVYSGINGYELESQLIENFTVPRLVTYTFIGYEEGTQSQKIKKVQFWLQTQIRAPIQHSYVVCQYENMPLEIAPNIVFGGVPPYSYLWNPGGYTTDSLIVYPPFQNTAIEFVVTDQAGCSIHNDIQLSLKNCVPIIDHPTEESNDTLTQEDPPVPDDDFSDQHIAFRSGTATDTHQLSVYPVPTTDFINIKWPAPLMDAIDIIILDPRGQTIYQEALTTFEKQEHQKKINVREYADGVYFLVLQTKHSMLVSKLVKM